MAGNWTKLTITGNVKDTDSIVAVMSMLDNGLMIEDYSDFSLNGMYGDLVDDSILNADKTTVKVSIFVPEEKKLSEYTSFLKERFSLLGISIKLTADGMNEEDWSESWKKYYKPIPLGKVTIVPAWEKYEAKDGEIIIKMDPGMAFGTGTHETTRLVIKLLEKYIKSGMRVADVGCGSGILAICASKLGAGECKAYDIDPVAVKVANENIKDSGLTNVTCEVSDLLKQVDKSGGTYDVICANIVADIIIRMMPDVGALMDENSVILASGIIVERSEDVINGFEEHGFKIVERIDENGWCALAVQKA